MLFIPDLVECGSFPITRDVARSSSVLIVLSDVHLRLLMLSRATSCLSSFMSFLGVGHLRFLLFFKHCARSGLILFLFGLPRADVISLALDPVHVRTVLPLQRLSRVGLLLLLLSSARFSSILSVLDHFYSSSVSLIRSMACFGPAVPILSFVHTGTSLFPKACPCPDTSLSAMGIVRASFISSVLDLLALGSPLISQSLS